MTILEVIFVTFALFENSLSAFNYTNCGRQRPDLDSPGIFIVGGTEADPGEYPWQAALYRYDRRICGATVIHPEWIITAAHCVEVINDPPIFDYLVGSTRISDYEDSPYYQFRETSELYVHPNYRLESHDFDIALMRMSKPFVWDDDGYVYPACVPSADMVDKFPQGSDGIITGWGAEMEGGYQSDELNEVTMPITNQTYCNESYSGSITDNMICAGLQEGGVDSCEGDSGGPMVAVNPDDGLWYLIGVVSWGSGCARPGYPGVYARVTTFADWIEPIFNGGTPEGMPVGLCSDNDFQCAGGFCIPEGSRCDGSRDCYQYTDELYCETALKPFGVFFDKRLDPSNQSLVDIRATDSNECGLHCLQGDCHAFDVLPDLDDENRTVCHLVFEMDYLIQNLTLNESRVLGITHFQLRPSAGWYCDTLETMAPGVLLTPRYGIGDYPRDVRCRSLIRAPENHTVRLEVESFRIEFDGSLEGSCWNDWDTLTIYDGYDLMGTYCGDMIPTEFVSTSTDLFVVFESDSSIQDTGYKLNFFFIPEKNVVVPSTSMKPSPRSSSPEPPGATPVPVVVIVLSAFLVMVL